MLPFVERQTLEQTAALPGHTNTLRRSLLHSPVRRTLAAATLGIAAIMQHDTPPEARQHGRHHVAAKQEESAPAHFESLHGSSLMDRHVQVRYRDFEGRSRTIALVISRDPAERDLRLNVNGKKFRCDESYPMVGKVSELIDDVTVHDDGDGICLRSDEHGEASITRMEMSRVLERLAGAESPVTTLQVQARFIPKKHSNTESVYKAVNMIGGLLGADTTPPSSFTVRFTYENGDARDVAAK